MTTRTFIYGSCVSRDTFERLPKDDFELIQYVARQSLISAYAPPSPSDPPEFHTTSDFQRRMIIGDWQSNLIPLLREHAHDVDLLLWDLCDERLGLREIQVRRHSSSSAVATRSVDSIRAGMDQQLGQYRLVPFASRRHRLLFLRSVRGFVQELESLSLLERTILMAPAWARTTVAGRRVPASFGLAAYRANRIFDDYYRTVRLVAPDVNVVSLGPDEVTAGALHEWGLAPFHYSEDVYTTMTSEITRLNSRKGYLQ